VPLTWVRIGIRRPSTESLQSRVTLNPNPILILILPPILIRSLQPPCQWMQISSNRFRSMSCVVDHILVTPPLERGQPSSGSNAPNLDFL